jgi:hypothetical protein
MVTSLARRPAVSLPVLQQGRRLRVLGFLQRMRISSMFSQPIDPERDNGPTYLQIIHRAMDLATVRRKLEPAQYHPVQQWKHDVELTWENSYDLDGGQALPSLLAKGLRQMFRDKTDNLTDSPFVDLLSWPEIIPADIDRIGILARQSASPANPAVTVMAARQTSAPIQAIQPTPDRAGDRTPRPGRQRYR